MTKHTMTDHAILNAKLAARRYRLATRLANVTKCAALAAVMLTKADMYANLAHSWRVLA